VMQKWTLLTTYWNRIMREIEAGTYGKDLAKVSRRLASKGAPLSEQEAVALGIPASRAKALVARQSRRYPPGAAPQAPLTAPQAPLVAPTPATRPEPAVPGMSEADIEALHRRYDEAARNVDKGRPAPTLARLKEILAKQVPQLLAQHGAARVSFDVAVKDGRVVLRAKPQK
jgi:hypothetical protein